MAKRFSVWLYSRIDFSIDAGTWCWNPFVWDTLQLEPRFDITLNVQRCTARFQCTAWKQDSLGEKKRSINHLKHPHTLLQMFTLHSVIRPLLKKRVSSHGVQSCCMCVRAYVCQSTVNRAHRGLWDSSFSQPTCFAPLLFAYEDITDKTTERIYPPVQPHSWPWPLPRVILKVKYLALDCQVLFPRATSPEEPGWISRWVTIDACFQSSIIV